MRDIRAVTRVVGRRTALRYLAIGAGASLLAACGTGNGGGGKSKSGDGSGSTGGTGGTGGGQPKPKPTVAERALTAFVSGKWSITSQIAGDEKPVTYTANITDGWWTLEFGEGQTSNSMWDISGGRLSVQVPEKLGSGEDGDVEEAAASNVPATVGDAFSLVLPWQPPGASGTGGGEKLSVDYSAKTGTLRIRHIDGSSVSTHTCTRV
ncbi:hypothetical protein [Streptomyces sp. NPDC051909]|uniref:hypothetical protein n=1 Tax=Streptomyces sp. NPDC051909 TaxID=3154944 RepID=UPI00344685F9